MISSKIRFVTTYSFLATCARIAFVVQFGSYSASQEVSLEMQEFRTTGIVFYCLKKTQTKSQSKHRKAIVNK